MNCTERRGTLAMGDWPRSVNDTVVTAQEVQKSCRMEEVQCCRVDARGPSRLQRSPRDCRHLMPGSREAGDNMPAHQAGGSSHHDAHQDIIHDNPANSQPVRLGPHTPT